MPSDYRRGLENCQCIEHLGRKAIEVNKHKTIDIAEDEPFRRPPPQYNELMSEDENFCSQSRTRPKQPGHHAPNRPAEIAH
jgi:hypothetical protein